MELPRLVGLPRPPVCDLPPMEPSPPDEAPQLLGGGLLLMALTALVRVAHLAAGRRRRVGLPRLVGVARLPVAGSRRAEVAGVARPPVAGSRRMGLLAASGVQLAAVGRRLVGAVGFRLAGAAAVAAGRPLVELARPGAGGPRPARACR
jgi:hypothetical protein